MELPYTKRAAPKLGRPVDGPGSPHAAAAPMFKGASISSTLLGGAVSELSPSAAILNQLELMQLGKKYEHLRQFVRKNSNLAPEFSTTESVYIQSVCQGLSQILDEYLQFVIKVKEGSNEQLQHESLHGIAALFDQLELLVVELETKPRSGDVMNVLVKHAQCGIHHVSKIVNRLWIQFCHGVLVHQLISWMLYAELVCDPYHEFFIRRAYARKTETEAVLFEEWKARYTLQHDFLPQYLHRRVADKILFIGRASEVINQHYVSAASLEQEDNAELQQLLGKLKHAASKEVFLRDELDFHEVGVEDQRQVVRDLEYVVNQAYELVSARLWQFVVASGPSQGNLAQILDSFRGFFLLGHGEVYHEFLAASAPILLKASRETASQSKRDVLQTMHLLDDRFKRAVDHIAKDDRYASRFQLNFCWNQPEHAKLLVLGDCYRREKNALCFLMMDPNQEPCGSIGVGSLWSTQKIEFGEKSFISEFILAVEGSKISEFTMLLQDQGLGLGIENQFERGIAARFSFYETAREGEDVPVPLCRVTLELLGQDGCHETAVFEADHEGRYQIRFLFDTKKQRAALEVAVESTGEHLASVGFHAPPVYPKLRFGYIGFTAHASNMTSSFEVLDWKTLDSRKSTEMLYDWETDFWNNISLDFKFNNAAESIFFGFEAMTIYNSLFRILLRLFSVHLCLKQSWYDLKKQQHRCAPSTPDARFAKFLNVSRHKMHLVVQHILLLLQVEVLDENFTKLKDIIQSESDFDNAQKHHMTYLRNIYSSFADHSFGIINICRLAYQFSALISSYTGLTESVAKDAQRISVEFDKLMQRFAWIMKNTKTKEVFLANLLHFE